MKLNRIHSREQEVDKFIDVLFALELITWDKHGALQWWSIELRYSNFDTALKSK